MKKFKDLSNGSIVTIVNVDNLNNMAIMDNGSTVGFDNLSDRNRYQEVSINESVNTTIPNTSSDINMNSTNRYEMLAGMIKNVDVQKVQAKVDDGAYINEIKSVYDSDSVVNRMRNNMTSEQPTYQPTYQQTTEINTEEYLLKLEESRKAQMNKQNELLSKFVDETDINIQPSLHTNTNVSFIPEYDEFGNIINAPNNSTPTSVIPKTQISTPTPPQPSIYHSLIKNIKKTVPHDILIKYEVMIPEKSLIEILDDSFDVSIVDILVEEYYNKVINDKETLKEKIREHIESYVKKGSNDE